MHANTYFRARPLEGHSYLKCEQVQKPVMFSSEISIHPKTRLPTVCRCATYVPYTNATRESPRRRLRRNEMTPLLSPSFGCDATSSKCPIPLCVGPPPPLSFAFPEIKPGRRRRTQEQARDSWFSPSLVGGGAPGKERTRDRRENFLRLVPLSGLRRRRFLWAFAVFHILIYLFPPASAGRGEGGRRRRATFVSLLFLRPPVCHLMVYMVKLEGVASSSHLFPNTHV